MTTLGDLKFGVNIHKGDYLPYPKEDALRKINDENDLINHLQDKDPELEVIIDRSKPWSQTFTVPAWEEGIANTRQGMADWIRDRKAATPNGKDPLGAYGAGLGEGKTKKLREAIKEMIRKALTEDVVGTQSTRDDDSLKKNYIQKLQAWKNAKSSNLGSAHLEQAKKDLKKAAYEYGIDLPL